MVMHSDQQSKQVLFQSKVYGKEDTTTLKRKLEFTEITGSTAYVSTPIESELAGLVNKAGQQT
jgi:hypothetical protein